MHNAYVADVVNSAYLVLFDGDLIARKWKFLFWGSKEWCSVKSVHSITVMFDCQNGWKWNSLHSQLVSLMMGDQRYEVVGVHCSHCIIDEKLLENPSFNPLKMAGIQVTKTN